MSDFRQSMATGVATTPPLSLLCKLGSIAVHAEEAMSDEGHGFDMAVLRVLLADSEVVEWLAAMNDAALLPIKRAGRKPARQETP